jgi:hypothetical protein
MKKLSKDEAAFMEQAIMTLYDEAVLAAGPAGMTHQDAVRQIQPAVKEILRNIHYRR